MAEPGLRAQLATDLPNPLAVGRGTAIFLEGRCSHPRERIRSLSVVLDGAAHPVAAHGMSLPGTITPGDWWWAIVPIGPLTAPAAARLTLRAALAGGGEAEAPIGTLELDPGSWGAKPPWAPPPGEGAGEPLIAICMATFDPPLDLFRRQVDSIRAQGHRNWVCLISDDASGEERLAGMREVLAGDERFRLTRAERRAGFYRNFERALALVPREAAYVALSDQDDRWYPDKLEVLRAALGPDTRLAYSDMRVVDRSGEVISDTYWAFRRNNHTSLASLIIANTITGAASLFPRELLDYALPFPPRHGNSYHDHWIALVAMALGRVSYVDRPLYDYVQHRDAMLGYGGATAAWGPAPRRLSRWRHRARYLLARASRLEMRTKYFRDYCGLALWARVLELRGGALVAPEKRRALERFLSCEGSLLGSAWLAARLLRPLFGANETLSMEGGLVAGIAWRRLAGAAARVRRP